MLGLTFNVEDGRITIFRSTLEALGWPTHYRFLYNREAKQVAVQNCTAEDAGAHKTPKLTVSNSCEIKCVALVRMIYRDMRWNRNNTYRLEGKSIPRQQLVSFDLGTPFLVENGKALDENPSPTKPLCGEEVSAAESSSVSPIKRNSGAMWGACGEVGKRQPIGSESRMLARQQGGRWPGGQEAVQICLLNKTVIIITPDKSTQQVNKITFVPMNDKNKWLSSLMAIGNKWFCSLRKSELFTPPGVLGDAIIW